MRERLLRLQRIITESLIKLEDLDTEEATYLLREAEQEIEDINIQLGALSE